MHEIDFIAAEQYGWIFNSVIFILCFGTFLKYFAIARQSVLYNRPTFPVFTIGLSVLLILFMGLRPYSYVFVDTGYYIYSYEHSYQSFAPINLENEWLWAFLAYSFRCIGLNANEYLLAIETSYIGLMLYCCKKLFPNNLWVAMLFCFSSFSFFTFGVNGIRNGMACSLILVGFAIISTKKNNTQKNFGILLLLLATGIHRSTMLPSMCFIIAHYFWRVPAFAIQIWFICIIISLIFGNYFAELFADIGVDDRMQSYLNAQYDAETIKENSSVGTFRFDFLLYSAMPILFFWYVTIKRNFKNKIYNLFAITYILANSFWVIVIRASQSNRFAYLSWFLYPIIIAYPLIRLKIWKDQDRKTAIILLLYAGFTFTMFLLGK